MLLLDEECACLEEAAGFADDASILVEVRSRDGTWPEEIDSLCNSSSSATAAAAAASAAAGTEPRRRSSVFTPTSAPRGVAGLNNLGNTCYLNSAVQCVANTKILGQYFNLNYHLFELNRTNALGMKGHIAKRFGDLVREMWTSETRTIAPIKLRWTIGRYRTHFAGFQQQDAQELLAFLLDGLHEDLVTNTISLVIVTSNVKQISFSLESRYGQAVRRAKGQRRSS
jgi:ubiquitin carboxyl-terminal hydrolase 6/32